MKIGYARVSSTSQNLESQIKALQEEGCEKIFTEKVSGKNMERPELLNMIDFAREGDIVVIRDTTRLGRNTVDLFEIIGRLKAKGVSIKSLKESWLDTTTPQGEFMFTVMSGMAQFERAMSKERQAEGIAIAKAQGKYKGRKKIELTDKFINAYKRFYKREIGVLEAMKEAGIKSRTTWYKLVDEYKSQPNYKMPCSCHTCKKIVEDSEKIIAEDGRYLCLKCANKEESKKGDSGEWVVPAVTKLTRKIKRDLKINILDKDCGASNINRTITDISIEYVFEYEGKTYMFEYLRNLDKIEVSILQK